MRWGDESGEETGVSHSVLLHDVLHLLALTLTLLLPVLLLLLLLLLVDSEGPIPCECRLVRRGGDDDGGGGV